MLAGMFHALALRAAAQGKTQRILLSLLILLFLYIIVAARTVAVWLALPVLLGLLVLGLWRLEGIRRKQWVLFAWGKRTVALILAGILLLGVLATWMAPDRVSTPLARLERLRPEVLGQGTRLRLWSIGLETLAPIPGGGISGFKLDYPNRRLYFERIPAPASPDLARPAWMHNEYLQAAVELGWPGALVLLWLALSALKWAAGLLKSARGDEVLARLCILLAMLGVLLHNLVSFEFHIISSAVVFLFGYAWLASQGAVSSSTQGTAATPSARWAAAAIIPLAVGVPTFAVREYQAEELFRRGHELRKAGFQSGRVEGPEAALAAYREAAKKLGEAFALAPYRGEFAYYAGWCHLETGRLEGSERQWVDASASLEEALRFYDGAAPTAPGPVLERDRAEAHLMLANLFQEKEERERAVRHFKRAEESLQKAAFDDPAEPDILLTRTVLQQDRECGASGEFCGSIALRIPGFAMNG
jgi:tetratricopeptide (TPR) repeat protein